MLASGNHADVESVRDGSRHLLSTDRSAFELERRINEFGLGPLVEPRFLLRRKSKLIELFVFLIDAAYPFRGASGEHNWGRFSVGWSLHSKLLTRWFFRCYDQQH